MIVQGDSGTTDITGITRTGEDDIVTFLLEEGTDGAATSGNIILNGTDGSSSNEFDNLIAEDRTSDVAMYSQVGSSSGTGSILSGVTTT